MNRRKFVFSTLGAAAVIIPSIDWFKRWKKKTKLEAERLQKEAYINALDNCAEPKPVHYLNFHDENYKDILFSSIVFKAREDLGLHITTLDQKGTKLDTLFSRSYKGYEYRDYPEKYCLSVPNHSWKSSDLKVSIEPDHSTCLGVESVELNTVYRREDILIENQNKIEGYLPTLSYELGQNLPFKVHAPKGSFDISIERLGAKEELVFKKDAVVGMPQAYRKYASINGAAWETTLNVQLPTNCRPGFYRATLKDQSASFVIPFVLRPQKQSFKNKLVYLVSTNTWHAYNNWAGASFYNYRINDRLGWKVSNILSTERPNLAAVGRYTRDFTFLNWLEEKNIPYEVATDLELHNGSLAGAKTILINAHNEYWTTSMVDNLENHLKVGGNVVSLSGNTIFFKAVIKDGQIEARKDSSFHQLSDENGGPWVDLKRPGSMLLGLTYSSAGYATFAPYEVLNPEHWIFTGTDLTRGSKFGEKGWQEFPGASGHETDKIDLFSPANLVHLAKGTNPNGGGADMIYFDHHGGGAVFAAGSVSFGMSVENDPKVSKIVENVLMRFQT